MFTGQVQTQTRLIRAGRCRCRCHGIVRGRSSGHAIGSEHKLIDLRYRRVQDQRRDPVRLVRSHDPQACIEVQLVVVIELVYAGFRSTIARVGEGILQVDTIPRSLATASFRWDPLAVSCRGKSWRTV